MYEYDIVYSIGSNCACALYLNQNDLRITSGPFDWLTAVEFNPRIDLICNDFQDFINFEDFEKTVYKYILPSANIEHYKNKRTGFFFLHDFSQDIPFADSFESVKQKYLRRINRFYENIQTKEKVLLVWFSLTYETADEDIIKASKRLNEKFKKNVDLLIIEHDDSLLDKETVVSQLTPNVIKYRLYAKKLEPTERFTRGNVKKCNQIFKKYALRRTMFEKIKRTFFKVIVNFIPVKKLRKEARNRLLRNN